MFMHSYGIGMNKPGPKLLAGFYLQVKSIQLVDTSIEINGRQNTALKAILCAKRGAN